MYHRFDTTSELFLSVIVRGGNMISSSHKKSFTQTSYCPVYSFGLDPQI